MLNQVLWTRAERSDPTSLAARASSGRAGRSEMWPWAPKRRQARRWLAALDDFRNWLIREAA